MFRHLMVSAVGAGVLTGMVAALLQFWLLVPVIGAAELYESGELVHFGTGTEAVHGHGAGDTTAHDHAHPAQSGVFGRHIGTLVATIASYLGFALFLVAGFALAEMKGVARISPMAGLLWGLAGFAATQLAPSLGLPPELPGSGAAAVSERQVWWLMTAALTVAGIAVLAGVSGPARWAGVLLLAAPHLMAAPHPDGFAGVAPPEMSALFAARVLGVGAIAWAVLGLSAGWIWRDQAPA